LALLVKCDDLGGLGSFPLRKGIQFAEMVIVVASQPDRVIVEK
jgi:hypothetical protein